jgi:hypothetical protein
VLTIGSLPVATIIAESKAQESGGVSLARAVNMYFIPATMLCFAVFLWNIEKKYFGTFFSLQKGKDLTVKNFREGKDEIKAEYSFGRSRHHWITIEEEVRAWVEANWEKWDEEKPKWFDEAMQLRVPVEYIPTSVARQREYTRRLSADLDGKGGLEGGLISSIRRASRGYISEEDAAFVVSENFRKNQKVVKDPNKLGKDLGEELLLALSGRKKGTPKDHAVRSFILTEQSLKGMSDKYAFIIPMFGAVVKNQLHGLRKVEGEALELNGKDGRMIGESLARSLAVNTQDCCD